MIEEVKSEIYQDSKNASDKETSSHGWRPSREMVAE